MVFDKELAAGYVPREKCTQSTKYNRMLFILVVAQDIVHSSVLVCSSESPFRTEASITRQQVPTQRTHGTGHLVQ